MKQLVFFWLTLLSGCALLPSSHTPVARPMKPESAPFTMNGRVSIKHLDEHHSAGLHWTHRSQTDELLLLTPLGQTVARVYRDDGNATLDTGGRHYQDVDAESLMEQVLGWHLPLDGLHHWVLGMAAPESPAQIEHAENGQISVLHQEGWEVRFLRYADNKRGEMTRCTQAPDAGMSLPHSLPQSADCTSIASEADSLPSRLQLTHEDFQIQLLIDEWDWNPQ
jgi:outer membrane lipoprotein LolB